MSLDRMTLYKKSGLNEHECHKTSLENIKRPIKLSNYQILHLIFGHSVQNFQYGVGTKFKKMKAEYSGIKYINNMIKINLSGSLKYSSFDKSIKLSELSCDDYCSDCDFTWLS